MTYTVRPYRTGEEHYVAEAHRRLYTEEYRWGSAFTDYAAAIALTFPRRTACEGEALWIAEADGVPVGSIMLCATDEPHVGQLRLFLVEPPYRRCGIGAALSGALLKKARDYGYRRLILWSASPLRDALRHYETLGFVYEEKTENREWSLDGDVVYEIKMSLSLQ